MFVVLGVAHRRENFEEKNRGHVFLQNKSIKKRFSPLPAFRKNLHPFYRAKGHFDYLNERYLLYIAFNALSPNLHSYLELPKQFFFFFMIHKIFFKVNSYENYSSKFCQNLNLIHSLPVWCISLNWCRVIDLVDRYIYYALNDFIAI